MSESEKESRKKKKKYKDNYTNTNYPRPFIIDKFLKGIYRQSEITDLKKGQLDPDLIKKRKGLKKIKIPKKINIPPNTADYSHPRYKTPLLNLMPNLQYLQYNLSERKIKMSHYKKLGRQRSELDLPMIVKQQTQNKSPIEEKTTMTLFDEEKNSKEDESHQEKLVTSEIMEPNNLYNNKTRKISVISFMNKVPGNKSLLENYKVFKDVNELNSKYNLNLNLLNKSKSTSNIFSGKKYNLYGKLNKLFQYYSSAETNRKNFGLHKYPGSIKSYYNNSSNYDSNENKINSQWENNDSDFNTLDVNKRTIEDDSNTFMTKLIYNTFNAPSTKKEKELDIIKKRFTVAETDKINEEVLDKDKKIGLHCFVSTVQKDISIKKILYKYIDRTVYEMKNDLTYKRTKEFEERITKILKRK